MIQHRTIAKLLAQTWKVVCPDVDDGISQLMSLWERDRRVSGELPSAPLSLGEQAARACAPRAGVPGWAISEPWPLSSPADRVSLPPRSAASHVVLLRTELLSM